MSLDLTYFFNAKNSDATLNFITRLCSSANFLVRAPMCLNEKGQVKPRGCCRKMSGNMSGSAFFAAELAQSTLAHTCRDL